MNSIDLHSHNEEVAIGNFSDEDKEEIVPAGIGNFSDEEDEEEIIPVREVTIEVAPVVQCSGPRPTRPMYSFKDDMSLLDWKLKPFSFKRSKDTPADGNCLIHGRYISSVVNIC